jgi:predicted ester cyclase
VVSNRQNLEQAIRCFGDPQQRHEYFRLYSDDIVLHGYQGVRPGLESVKQFYHAFWTVFPDARVTIQDTIEQGETLVTRYVISGTQHEAFMGIAAAGQRIELEGISILRFSNGKCFERWTCSDSLVLLNQVRAPIVAAS